MLFFVVWLEGYVRPIDLLSTNDDLLKSDTNTNRRHCCVPPAGTFTPKKSPSNVRSVGRASVSPGLWLSTKHYTCRSRNWSQPRSSDSLCQQGRDGDTGKNKTKTNHSQRSTKDFFFFFHLSCWRMSPLHLWEYFSRMKNFTSQFLKKLYRNKP